MRCVLLPTLPKNLSKFPQLMSWFTSFLGWRAAPAGAAGLAQVELDTWQMIAAFGSRFQTSRAPADLAAARNAHPLRLKLTRAAWTRILNEYLASGLLRASTVRSREDLRAAIGALTLVNPAHLVLTAADWDLGEAIDFAVLAAAVPGVAGVPGASGRDRHGAPGYRAPVAPVPAVAAIQ